MGISTGTDVQKYLAEAAAYLSTTGTRRSLHQNKRCLSELAARGALSPRLCQSHQWVSVPSVSVQDTNSPVQCKMVAVRERGLKELALKERQSGQFLNNKSASVLDKWMLRAQKLHLQETLIPYPSLRKDLKHQHLRILLFPSFPLWNVDISWVNRRVRARRDSFSHPNQHIYFNAVARRWFPMRNNFYDINGKNYGDFLPSLILAGFDNSQK